jgi:hypothetical protein
MVKSDHWMAIEKAAEELNKNRKIVPEHEENLC